MAQESEESISKLRSIHIDLEEQSIETLAQDGVIVRLTFSPEGVFQQLLRSGSVEGASQRLLSASEGQPDTAPEANDQVNPEAPAKREKQPALVLPGKLQTKPAEGRPDGRGNPTAWARFLAHMEGQEGAVLLSATFHNHTRDIALKLAEGDAIRAQGYLHPHRDSSRLSTFSIFHLLGYPGKPASGR
jgi:hypothetical protein